MTTPVTDINDYRNRNRTVLNCRTVPTKAWDELLTTSKQGRFKVLYNEKIGGWDVLDKQHDWRLISNHQTRDAACAKAIKLNLG